MARPLTLSALVASILAMCAAMVLGTSDAVPFFGPTGPFLTLHGSPSHGLVAALTWFAALSAGLGTLTGLRCGRLAAPGRLLAAGIVTAGVLALLPPAGSVDMLNYAIYGRIADLGRDPYVTTPFLLARTGDRVGVLLPSGWQRVPTVYGPITTAVQWAAAHVGGGSMARILWLLKWANAAAFAGTAVLLDRLAGPDPLRRVRAHLLWTVNPIMLFWMVGSGHADVFAVFFLVVALSVARRPGFAWAAGAAGGAAVAVKASFLFPAAALVMVAWYGEGPRLRRAAATAGGLVAVAGGGYLLAGPAAIHSLNARLGRKKDRYLPVPDVILNHHGLYAVWMGVLAVGLTAFLWWRSGLPIAFWRRAPEAGLLPVTVLAFGTTLVSPLQYPWYDAMLLPLLAVTALPGILAGGRKTVPSRPGGSAHSHCPAPESTGERASEELCITSETTPGTSVKAAPCTSAEISLDTSMKTPLDAPSQTPRNAPPAQTSLDTPAKTALDASAKTPLGSSAKSPLDPPAKTPLDTPAKTPLGTPAKTPLGTPAKPPLDTPARTSLGSSARASFRLRLDSLLVVRGVMLALMTLPGVRVGGYQHLAVRWLDLAWLLVFLVVVWRGTRRRGEPAGPRRERKRSMTVVSRSS